MAATKTSAADLFTLLSVLALQSDRGVVPETISRSAGRLAPADLTCLFEIANTHHVVLRALPCLAAVMAAEANSRLEQIENAVTAERMRIANALSRLSEICGALGEIGDVIVIKSLDHKPDLGNDLDLYINGPVADLVSVMRERFHARLEKQSWGDRLANKWNFTLPGLPELVEVHVSRLGQTGEQIAITNSLVARSRIGAFGNHRFRVPGVEEQIIISTLQRMYRHFYIRLCDIVNIAGRIESGAIHYGYLESLATSAGLWDGLTTYLVVIADYVEKYRGSALPLPASVRNAARFGCSEVSYRQKFLRIPIFPQAATLYAREWARLVANGEIQNTLRLSLLPGLAMAALVAAKISGSDKGIW
ncbi:MAG: hypothetical protein ACRD3B_00190 [Candidatus Sulfotelmatobacter sp.]